jgi:Cu(I)/Ag(I) efflux system membrane fusion protein
MTRAGLPLAILAAAVGAGGYIASRPGANPPWRSLLESVLPAAPASPPASVSEAAPPPAAAERPVLYYRDPDRPFYSLAPGTNPQGRDYVAVRRGDDVSFDEPAPEPAKVSGDGRRIRYYRNPMGLPDYSPVPKKDSMGMDYVPVYEAEEDEADGSVKVPLGKVQKSGVRSEPVGRRVISRSVRAPGTVQLDERGVGVIALRFEAFVERVGNVTTGDRVRKGQPLVQLYSPEVAAAAAQFITALGPASEAAIGARRRLENLAVPADVIADLARTRNVPHAFVWPAPYDGVVLERKAVAGMRAGPGDVLFRLADMSVVWVLADVAERDLGAVAPGQTVTVRPRALPGRSFPGRVALVYPQLNKETRTAPVRVELPNPDGSLLPNMYADVEIATGSGTPLLAVPDSAVIDSGTRRIVILDKGEGRFEPREIEAGQRGDGYTEIRNGLAEGERVVVAANFLIDAESNLKAALRGFGAPDRAP